MKDINGATVFAQKLRPHGR